MFKVSAWISVRIRVKVSQLSKCTSSTCQIHGTCGASFQGPNLAFVLSSGDAPLVGKHGMAVFQGGQRIKESLCSFETFQGWKQIVILITLPGDM